MLDSIFWKPVMYFLAFWIALSDLIIEHFKLYPMAANMVAILILICLIIIVFLILIGLFNLGNYIEYFLRSKFKSLRRYKIKK